MTSVDRRPILVVEDNPDDVLLTRRAMEKAGLANPIEIAEDGARALAMLGDATRPRPAVVLLDLKLPKVDGLEVLQRIRADERTRFLPVVILTTSREERDLIEGYRLGANSYIRKPVNFNQFADAVSQMGMYWLVLNESPATA